MVLDEEAPDMVMHSLKLSVVGLGQEGEYEGPPVPHFRMICCGHLSNTPSAGDDLSPVPAHRVALFSVTPNLATHLSRSSRPDTADISVQGKLSMAWAAGKAAM
jgi:hypothetical protein